MYRSILVPVDGSKLAERVLSIAIPLAEAHGARLSLLQAHEKVMPLTVGGGVLVHDMALDEAFRREQRAYLERLVGRVQKLTAVRVEGMFREGHPSVVIVEAASAPDVDLVIMSTHGRGGLQRFWLGSVSDAVVRQVHVPVLLVRGARPIAKRLKDAPPFSRVVVPLDGSSRAEQALEATRTLLGATPGRITLVHVVHPMTAMASANVQRDAAREASEAYLAPLAQRLQGATLEVRHETAVSTQVARVVLEAAETHSADLIAIAGQGLSGVQRFLVGSVADKLIRTAAVPVLVVPARERPE